MALRTYGEYPPDWSEIATRVKREAGWCCIRCNHRHDLASGHVLTVHHWDGNKANCRWFNLLALCQKCHLTIQARVSPDRPWVFVHSHWFKRYAAGFYADKYLGLELTRVEVEERLNELLSLEAMHILGTKPLEVAHA